jgi:hypothetical protein
MILTSCLALHPSQAIVLLLLHLPVPRASNAHVQTTGIFTIVTMSPGYSYQSPLLHQSSDLYCHCCPRPVLSTARCYWCHTLAGYSMWLIHGLLPQLSRPALIPSIKCWVTSHHQPADVSVAQHLQDSWAQPHADVDLAPGPHGRCICSTSSTQGQRHAQP